MNMKIKSLNFKVELEGNGIVNYDSNDQKNLWNGESKKGNKNKFTSFNNNNMYAKKTYYRSDDGELLYKIKISSDALRKAMFGDDAIAQNPSIKHNKPVLCAFIGSPLGLIKGYCLPDKTESISRKSPFTITSAEQTNNAESYMEFHSRSGQKNVGDDSDKSDTTIFNKETIGKITYSAEGTIDFQGLEFISCDTIFDRYGFNSDDYSILKPVLSNYLPNFDSDLGYYQLITSSIKVSEYGIKFTNEQIVFLIKEALKRILNFRILRSGSYVKMSKLTVELVINPINSKENIFIEINSIDDIENLSFEVVEHYVLTDTSESIEKHNEIERKLIETLN
jgi:hypothetical protein